ncbi:Uncharacterised protein [Helicobacter fennelliae]|uniref:Uncharacterized protein n=1 Tax=Helicobacter fennelliae TaxID=215 RepID=A0A2X3EIL2_9HELI|nr:hypothetical protein [Helicobacter fennelliae]SQC36291.1 Uncharacterised protein [Helicobacter fennelliae]
MWFLDVSVSGVALIMGICVAFTFIAFFTIYDMEEIANRRKKIAGLYFS